MGGHGEWLEEDEPVYTTPAAPTPGGYLGQLAAGAGGGRRRHGGSLRPAPHPLRDGSPSPVLPPFSHCHTELLRPSDSLSHCPYKGTASYFSLAVGAQLYPDLAWIYRSPLPESARITGLVAFYNEKVDLTVDGVLQERPHTAFS